MRCGGLLACRGSEALVNISRPRQIAGDYQQGEYLADQGTHRSARVEDMQFADKLVHYAHRGSPGRLEAVDPQTLRERADELPREEILGRYSQCRSAADIIEVYRPLVETIEADVVTLQMASTDQEGLIKLLGSEVLPELRKMAEKVKG